MVADLGPGSKASALLLCMTDCPDSGASFLPAGWQLQCRTCSHGSPWLREVHIPSAGTAERGRPWPRLSPGAQPCPLLPISPRQHTKGCALGVRRGPGL